MSAVIPALLRAFVIAAASGLACCATNPESAGSPARLAKASCSTSTGSRIALPRTECRNAPGSSYSKLSQF